MDGDTGVAFGVAAEVVVAAAVADEDLVRATCGARLADGDDETGGDEVVGDARPPSDDAMVCFSGILDPGTT